MGGTCAAVCYVLLQAIRLDVRTLPAPVRQQHRSVNAASDMGRPLVIESKTFSVYGAAYWGLPGRLRLGCVKTEFGTKPRRAWDEANGVANGGSQLIMHSYVQSVLEMRSREFRNGHDSRGCHLAAVNYWIRSALRTSP